MLPGDDAETEMDSKRAVTDTDRIFGNALSSDSDDEETAKNSPAEPLDDEDLQRRAEAMQALSASSDEEEAPRRQKIVVHDSIPKVRVKLGKGPVFVRPPNFLSIDHRPFNSHPDAYRHEVDDDEVYDDEGRARLKLKIENTIRWRWVKDPKTGDYKKQSNAKFVKWSDGTMSMYMGDEIFEVQQQSAMPNMHLYVRVGAALQAQAIVKDKYTFRPHSTDTVTHRKLTLNMADKSNKGPKVKMVSEVGMNPEKQRREMVKKEEEALRAAARKSAQQRRVKERAREVGLTSGFIEGDDSDEEGDIGAIKRGFKNRTYNDEYSDDSEEDERSRRVLREAKIIDSDSDDNRASSSRQKKKHKIIEEDDEEE